MPALYYNIILYYKKYCWKNILNIHTKVQIEKNNSIKIIVYFYICILQWVIISLMNHIILYKLNILEMISNKNFSLTFL